MRPPGGATRVAAVIGSPIDHSLSPVLHNAAFAAAGLDWVFVALEVAAGAGHAAIDAMRVLGIEGLSVTMPHKSDVVVALDRVSPAAAALDSVNCIVRDGDELVGYSTDGAGFVDSLHAEGREVAGRSFGVIGAGGAARSLVDSLARGGAREIVVVNRTPDRADRAVALAPGIARRADARALGDVEVVVNATSVGMSGGGAEAELPLDPGRLSSGQLAVDLVYEPLDTPFLLAARERGLDVMGGLGMLIHQAGHAFRLWTGTDAPLDAMAAAGAAELARRAG